MNSIHSALGRNRQSDKGIIPIKEDVFYRFLAVAEADPKTSEMMGNAHLLRTLARMSDYRVNEERLRKEVQGLSRGTSQNPA